MNAFEAVSVPYCREIITCYDLGGIYSMCSFLQFGTFKLPHQVMGLVNMLSIKHLL